MRIPDANKLRLGRWVLIAAAIAVTAANLMALVDRTDPPATRAILDRYTAMIPDDQTPETRPADGKDEPKKTKSKDKDARVERVCKRQLFSPVPPAKEFAVKLTGVLGDTAYVDGSNAVRVGDQHNGAKLTAIGPDWVTFEFEGTTHTLHVFGAGGGGGGPSASGPSPPIVHSASPGGSPPQPSRGSEPPVRMRPSGAGQFSPEMIARMKEEFAKLSPEKQAEAMERMPSELRDALMK